MKNNEVARKKSLNRAAMPRERSERYTNQSCQKSFIDKKTGEIFRTTPTGKRSTAKSPKSSLTLDQIQSQKASKSSTYWANMRTNIALTYRSKVIQDSTIDLLRQELSDILDSGILTYPQTLEEIGLAPGMTLQEKKVELGLRTMPYRHNEDEQRFLDDMANKADQVRKSNWAFRIAQEAQEKQDQGWHPFFVTLTVDPDMCNGIEYIDPETHKKYPAYDSPKELWQRGREFRRYIRSLADIVCKEMGHNPSNKPPYRPESDYVTYAGVIEHGKSREHHHGHFIIWLRAIPASWRQCPNEGIRNPANRTRNECLPMRAIWEWSLPGLSPALYFRSIGDIWETEYSFTLPLDKKTGKAMRVSLCKAAGRYITKYLSKEHKEWHHRMKATRNLGMRKLKQTLAQTEEKVVEALTWRAKDSQLNHSLIMTHSVPLGLMRLEAKRQNYLNKFRRNQMDLTELLSSNYGVFTRMLSSVRHGARPDRMDSTAFFDWVGDLLPAQRGYCETRQVVAHTYIGTIFPPEKTRVDHVKIGANEIGQ